MKNPIKALEAIEALTGGDFGLDLETLLAGNKGSKDLRTAAKIIVDIFCIAHSEVSKCNHPEWEELKYEVLKNYETR